MRKFLYLLLLALCPMICFEAGAQQSLDNTSVIKMVKAGLSADIVVSMVNSQPGHYEVSPEALIDLKKAGVNDKVISAMISRNASGGANGAGAAPAGAMAGAEPMGANGLPAGVDSIGFYYQDKTGTWTEMNAEVVNFKTGGALKHIGTAGIVKGDLNGNVAGFHSKLPLAAPASFILYTADGVSPGEYQLVRFRMSSDAREFRALTGGVAHTSGGATRDIVDFTTKKIAPHVYQITIDVSVGKGEYGFLPPMDASGGKNLANSGKIYTFSLGE
jgi:hypothetical protein